MVRGFRKGVKQRRPCVALKVTVLLNSRAKRGILSRCALGGQWRTYVTDEPRIGGSAGQKVGARRRQAQDTVGPPANHICIRLVLSVVEPPADGAQLKGSRGRERPASAAEAAHIRGLHTALDGACTAELRKIVIKIS